MSKTVVTKTAVLDSKHTVYATHLNKNKPLKKDHKHLATRTFKLAHVQVVACYRFLSGIKNDRFNILSKCAGTLAGLSVGLHKSVET